jgi:hypothetical protein
MYLLKPLDSTLGGTVPIGQVVVQIKKGIQFPKTDIMGHCDAFARISLTQPNLPQCAADKLPHTSVQNSTVSWTFTDDSLISRMAGTHCNNLFGVLISVSLKMLLPSNTLHSWQPARSTDV